MYNRSTKSNNSNTFTHPDRADVLLCVVEESRVNRYHDAAGQEETYARGDNSIGWTKGKTALGHIVCGLRGRGLNVVLCEGKTALGHIVCGLRGRG